MTFAVYLPLLLALPLTVTARRIAARGTPGSAAWALTVAAVIAAACSTWSLILLALTMLDDLPPLSALDDHPTLELPEPVPGPIALVAGLLLLAGGARLLTDVRLRLATYRDLRAISEPGERFVVADLATPMAVAVPGTARRPGHLLVTTGILRLLDADERRVLFAHERAHLDRHHHRLVAAAAAAAALNPLLIPVRETVAYLVERWADEDAAADVGDRALTAKAVARAALATAGTPPLTALGIGGGAAVQRVRALTAPAPAPRRRRLVVPMLVVVVFLAVVTVATGEFIALARAWL
ncbi:M48 family metalloprotease [Actinoplanes palleronii]|uniref:Membrane protein n=1 Tax=Actinoplanes palleronii TaxID=113570 RepID=A0ABQ4BFJ4_9ACTN|nr:M48 family metalloprotease [Actinoplanes palleronii]GIE69419.1 membrane protein [Actinoplanes palleronii]